MKMKASYKISLMLLFALLVFINANSNYKAFGEESKRVGGYRAKQSSEKLKPLVTIDGDLTTITPQQLAEMLVGVGVSISNVTFSGDLESAGAFSDGVSDGIGIEDGVILTSGSIYNAIGPNGSDDLTANNGLPGDSDLDSIISGTTHDACVLEFDFIPTEETLTFNFVFASEEYNEYVGSAFNDVFAFFLDGTNIALLPDGITPVSINNINNSNNPGYYNDNDPSDLGIPTPDNTQYDGFTTVLTVNATVTPGETHHMKLAIADTADFILDSGVFIAGGTFSAADPPTAATGAATNVTCESALLNGIVNANGLPTTAWFKYGTDTAALDNNSPTEDVGGSTDTLVSIGINSLLPNTIYYYQLVAQSNAGTSEGDVLSFTTTDCATAITLSSFTAKAGKNGSITLTWETATEVDNAGFNLYRSKNEDGAYKKINDALIPAQGNSVSGASYSFIDTPGKGVFYYKLEDVDAKGVSAIHGPEKARARSDDATIKRQKRR